LQKCLGKHCGLASRARDREVQGRNLVRGTGNNQCIPQGDTVPNISAKWCEGRRNQGNTPRETLRDVVWKHTTEHRRNLESGVGSTSKGAGPFYGLRHTSRSFSRSSTDKRFPRLA